MNDVRCSNQQVKNRLRELFSVLADGCHRGCDYDEAEGGLIEHCSKCQRSITVIAYELFIAPGSRGPLASALQKFLRATDETPAEPICEDCGWPKAPPPHCAKHLDPDAP